MKAAKAFTLIEMLVLIIIIAVFAAAVVPSYSRMFARTRFENDVREVRDLFAHARERAIARDTTAQLMFDAQTQTFAVMVNAAPPPTDQPIAFADDPQIMNAASQSEPPKGYTLPADVRVESFAVGGTGGNAGTGSSAIRFRSDGTCDGAQLRMVSENGYTADLLLMPATGQIKVEDVTK
jgi:Tfp pilus assembly protein FimT